MGLFDFFKKKEENTETIIQSPIVGEVIALSDVNDPVFSSGALGKGIGIIPENGNVVSPVNGEVVSAFPTGHAFGIKTDTGVEILIHIGIDTVSMEGDGFDINLTEGQKVNAGDSLGVFDISKIEAAGFEPTTMLIITNTADFETVETLKLGAVDLGDDIVRVEK